MYIDLKLGVGRRNGTVNQPKTNSSKPGSYPLPATFAGSCVLLFSCHHDLLFCHASATLNVQLRQGRQLSMHVSE